MTKETGVSISKVIITPETSDSAHKRTQTSLPVPLFMTLGEGFTEVRIRT